jgi:type II secretory pathway pseudopilin PulG
LTLIEIITVVAVMGLLMTLIAVTAPGIMRRWRIHQTEGLLAALDTALNAYATDHNGFFPWHRNLPNQNMARPRGSLPNPSGSLPDDDDGLDGEAVLHMALTSAIRRGPYYTGGQKWQVIRVGNNKHPVFADAWGRPIHYYAITDADEQATPLLESEGPRPDAGGGAEAQTDNLRNHEG